MREMFQPNVSSLKGGSVVSFARRPGMTEVQKFDEIDVHRPMEGAIDRQEQPLTSECESG